MREREGGGGGGKEGRRKREREMYITHPLLIIIYFIGKRPFRAVEFLNGRINETLLDCPRHL